MASNYSVRCTVLGTLALLTVACGTAEDETTVAPAGNVVAVSYTHLTLPTNREV